MQCGVRIRIHHKKNLRRVSVSVFKEAVEPLRNHREGNVEINTGKKNIARATIDKGHSAVPAAQVGDLLGFKSPGRVDGSTGVRKTRGENIKATGTGEAAPENIGLLEEAEVIGGIIERRKKLGVASLCSMHVELYARGTKSRCMWHRGKADGVEHRTADARRS